MQHILIDLENLKSFKCFKIFPYLNKKKILNIDLELIFFDENT